MKSSYYFYSFLLLGILGLLVYGFENYTGTMIGLIAFSSVFNFSIFLFKTQKKTLINTESATDFIDDSVDFYKVDNRTSYYINEQRKQANAN